jgi:hypothetical protein
MKEIVSRTLLSLAGAFALALMTMLFVMCENPTNSSGSSGTGVSVSDWAALAAALTNPAIREITINGGTGKITADSAVTVKGRKKLTLPAGFDLVLTNLKVDSNLTIACNGRYFTDYATVTPKGQMEVSEGRTVIVSNNIIFNLNEAALIVHGLLAFENAAYSLPAETNALVAGSGSFMYDYNPDYPDLSMIRIPAQGLIVQKPHYEAE